LGIGKQEVFASNYKRLDAALAVAQFQLLVLQILQEIGSLLFEIV
jgi:hypothetical protein